MNKIMIISLQLLAIILVVTATTSALGQSNNTSSAVEDEEPMIASLEIREDGTGWLTLNSSGTLSPVIPFTHTLTAANGYTIGGGIPFFTSNHIQVDLHSIDFASQVIPDPNANLTLPAKPKISPDVVSYYSQQGALISSRPPPPHQHHPHCTVDRPPTQSCRSSMGYSRNAA